MKPSILFLSSTLALLAALAIPAPAQAPDVPAQLQTDAYVQLVQGDQDLDAGRLEDALDRYQAARRAYGRLAAEYPSWEARIVRYRSSYCDNQIAEINRRIGERAAAYTAQTAATAPAAYYGAQPQDDPYGTGSYTPAPYAPSPYTPAPAALPESDYPAAQRRAESLQAQLDAARNAEQQARAELERVRAQLDRANRSLNQRSAEAGSELARLRDIQGRQQNELQLLRAENERLKTQLAAKADLDGALNDAERALNEARAENQSLQSQIADLQQDLEDAEDRIAQATALASAQTAEPAAEPAAEPPPFDPAAFDWPDSADFAASAPAPADEPASPEEPGDEPAAAPAAAAVPEPAPARVVATFPVRPVPRGMDPADFIRVLIANGEDETALANVQQARAEDPGDVKLATLEGIILIRLQHYAAAADLLHELTLENPDDATIHANLGAAWLGDGFYPGARAALGHAIELDPSIGGEYYYNYALVCAMTEPRDLDAARDAYNKALDAGVPHDPKLDALLQ
ncbi:MAG: hypothetical protein IKQ55_10605 [Kiritimatiellae bacterium]|nr:hypothetical protein [Kiritimatiellia bacterium]